MKREVCGWYLEDNEDIHTPYINPVEGDFKGFPKTLIMTAEYDYLRPECELFTKILQDAGVSVRHIRYGGIVHGTLISFITFPPSQAGEIRRHLHQHIFNLRGVAQTIKGAMNNSSLADMAYAHSRILQYLCAQLTLRS